MSKWTFLYSQCVCIFIFIICSYLNLGMLPIELAARLSKQGSELNLLLLICNEAWKLAIFEHSSYNPPNAHTPTHTHTHNPPDTW